MIINAAPHRKPPSKNGKKKNEEDLIIHATPQRKPSRNELKQRGVTHAKTLTKLPQRKQTCHMSYAQSLNKKDPRTKKNKTGSGAMLSHAEPETFIKRPLQKPKPNQHVIYTSVIRAVLRQEQKKAPTNQQKTTSLSSCRG